MPPPRPTGVPAHEDALHAILSASLRCVIYGSGGDVLFLRGSDSFTVTDLEMAKVEKLRALHRGEVAVADPDL